MNTRAAAVGGEARFPRHARESGQSLRDSGAAPPPLQSPGLADPVGRDVERKLTFRAWVFDAAYHHGFAGDRDRAGVDGHLAEQGHDMVILLLADGEVGEVAADA